MRSKKILGIVCAGMVAAQTLLPSAALAASGDSTARSASGTTEVTVRLASGSTEAGGVTEPKVIAAPEGTSPEDRVNEDGEPDPNGNYILNPLYNPDADGDGYGDNIAFSVPSAINFVASADGTLTGPSASATYIENLSSFSIRASSFKVDEAENWTIVDRDEEQVSVSNAVDFQFGPSADVLDAYDYLEKAAVSSPAAWNMAPVSQGGANNRVEMATSGQIHNVSLDISQAAGRVATIRTYVAAGNASQG